MGLICSHLKVRVLGDINLKQVYFLKLLKLIEWRVGIRGSITAVIRNMEKLYLEFLEE